MHLISEYQYICNGFGCKKNVLLKTIMFVYLGKNLTEKQQEKQTNRQTQSGVLYFLQALKIIHSVIFLKNPDFSSPWYFVVFRVFTNILWEFVWYCVTQSRPLVTQISPDISQPQSNSNFFHFSSLCQGKPPHFHIFKHKHCLFKAVMWRR